MATNRLLTMPEAAFINVLENSPFQELLNIDRALQNILLYTDDDDIYEIVARRRELIDQYIRRFRREPSPPPRQPKRKDGEDDEDDEYDEPPNQKDIYNEAKRQRFFTGELPSFSSYSQGTGMKGTGNKWVQHVKAYASKHGMKYGEALKDPKCRSSYKK